MDLIRRDALSQRRATLPRLNKPQQTLPSSSMVVEPRPNMSECAALVTMCTHSPLGCMNRIIVGRLPSYMNSSTPQSQVDYDLIFCSFDMAAITGLESWTVAPLDEAL
eukprot:3660206-Amphidinium_carterae.1